MELGCHCLGDIKAFVENNASIIFNIFAGGEDELVEIIQEEVAQLQNSDPRARTLGGLGGSRHDLSSSLKGWDLRDEKRGVYILGVCF